MRSHQEFRAVAFCAVLGVLAGLGVGPEPIQADEFVLDAAIIRGSIAVPGYTVASCSVTASAHDADGNYYYAATQAVDGVYELTVQGGGWEYELSYGIHLDLSGSGTHHNTSRFVTVAAGDEVTVDITTDAVITGTVEVVGQVVDGFQISAHVDGSQTGPDNPWFNCSMTVLSGDTYSIPVFGGERPVTVAASTIKLPAHGSEIHGLKVTDLIVPPNITTTQDFSVIVGFISGQVTVPGASDLSGWVYVQIPDPVNAHNGQAAQGPLAADGSYLMPAPAGSGGTAYGQARTDLGNFYLEDQTVSIEAGQTTTVDWDVEVPGSISGDLTVVGADYWTASIAGSAPPLAVRNVMMTSDGRYTLPGLAPGSWRISGNLYGESSAGSRRDVFNWSFPWAEVSVQSGQDVEHDLPLSMGYLEGTVLAPDSGAVPDVWQVEMKYEVDGYYQTGEGATSWSRDTYAGDGYGLNEFKGVMGPGSWHVLNATLRYKPQYQHTTGDGTISIYEKNYYNNQWMRPPVTVVAGVTSTVDLGYQTGVIYARMSVAGGGLFSDPYIYGNLLYNTDGVKHQQINLISSTEEQDIAEATVKLYAPPGTYHLSARGNYNGSYTTFGTFDVTIGPGDIVVTDPNAPVITVYSPEGGAEVTSTSVTITGNVWDDYGVDTLTINGVAVEFDGDGDFEYVLTGLTPGANTFTVAATDVNDNTATLARTVILVNSSPVAVISCQGTVEATNPAGALVTLDGSGSSDPDGNGLSYAWSVDDSPVGSGVTLDVGLALGSHAISLTVTDPAGATGTATKAVTVVNSTPPAVGSATADPSFLWPVDHKMRAVSILLAVADLVDLDVTCRIVGVTSSEPLDGDGDGNTQVDWEFTGEPGDLTLLLRAERSGKADGRTYTIEIECVDDFENLTTVRVDVPVAHDQGKEDLDAKSTEPVGDETAGVVTETAPVVTGQAATADVDGTPAAPVTEAPANASTEAGPAAVAGTTATGVSGPTGTITGVAGVKAGVTEGGTKPAGAQKSEGPQPVTTGEEFKK